MNCSTSWRPVCFALLLAAASLALPRAASAQSQGAAPTPSQSGTSSTVTLKEMLDKGLKARLPSEFEFNNRVVKLVNEGKISRKMVDSAFLWARYKKHPMEYFEFAMRAQAKKVRVTI